MKKIIIAIPLVLIPLISNDFNQSESDYVRYKSSAKHLEMIKKDPSKANGIYKVNDLAVGIAPSPKDSNKTWNTKPIESKYSINFDKNTSCLVRHLKVYKDPKWVGKIEARNGKTVYFSSPKSLFEFYFRPGKWFDVGVKSERDFSKIVVTDYVSLKAIDAEKAYFVYGSRAISPAGDDLVPFASEDGAKKFSEEYSGKRIMKFDEISDALIKLLNGRI